MAHQGGLLFLYTFLCYDCLFPGVRGDDVPEGDQPEARYALIGVGVGLILSILFVTVKLCMIKRHMLDNGFSSEDSIRKLSLRTQSTRLTRRDLPDEP